MNRPDKLTVFSRSDAAPKDVETGSMSPQTTKMLEDLYVRARDGAKGYREAAESVSAGSMKARLFGIARRRSAMAGQLELSLRALGIEASDAESGTSLHSFFEGLKHKLREDDSHSIVAEVVHGETSFAEAIDKALEQPLPANLRNLLERQKRQVRSMVDRFSAELGRESRLEALRHKAYEYRRPAAFALGALVVGALVGVAVVKQRRNRSLTHAIAKARTALDRSIAALPSSRQAKSRLPSLPHASSLSFPKSNLLDRVGKRSKRTGWFR
jgi:uncharacterized protein (TIGR02284 family)